MGDINVSVPVVATTIAGVAAKLTPLLLAPRDDGIPGALRPARIGLSRGGDRDFFRDSDNPVAPNTLDDGRLAESDFMTASALMNDSANCGPSLMSSRAAGSCQCPVTTGGAANESSPQAGDPPSNRAARPRSEDAGFD